MKNLVYFCFAVIMAAIAYSVISHSAMGDVAATIKYCDRNAAKAVSNAVANVEFMLPGLVTNQVNEYMAGKYTPSVITNVINNVETNYVSVVTNYYGTNIVVNIQTNYEATVTVKQFQDVDKDWMYNPSNAYPKVKSQDLVFHLKFGSMSGGNLNSDQEISLFQDEFFYIKNQSYNYRGSIYSAVSNYAFKVDGVYYINDTSINRKYFSVLCTAYAEIGTTNALPNRTKIIDPGQFEIITTKAGSIPDPFTTGTTTTRNLYVYNGNTAYYCGYVEYKSLTDYQITRRDNYYINGSGVLYRNQQYSSDVYTYDSIPRWWELLLILDRRYQMK